MTRRDEGKTSLVDFLRSIKYSSRGEEAPASECNTHFAALHPRVRQPRANKAEDQSLIRSAN